MSAGKPSDTIAALGRDPITIAGIQFRCWEAPELNGERWHGEAKLAVGEFEIALEANDRLGPGAYPAIARAIESLSSLDRLARAAIAADSGTEAGEHSVDLMVSHHLEELSKEQLAELFGVASPGPRIFLDRLVLDHNQYLVEAEGWVFRSLDYSLPGELTDYVLCVRFGEDGLVTGIEMES